MPSLSSERVRSVHGFVVPGFDAVAEEFERNIRGRGDTGAAFAVVVDGRPVLDLWGGLADRPRRERWRRDTLAGIFSGSKGLVAACLLRLIERGSLDLEKPVSGYWPEFASHGKEGILVRHVVSHLAGLPGLDTPSTPKEATDAARMAELLAEQPAICAPGERLIYHALTFGWLCGELIRRVDGRTVGQYLAEEIARPLDLDAWIGLPAEEDHRVAALERGKGFGAQPRDRSAGSGDDRLAWSIWANPPRFSADPLPVNSRFWRAAEIPASSGIASARSLARLYGCLARGGEIGGVRVLSPRTIALGTSCLACGIDPYLQTQMAFGVGFELHTEAEPLGPPTDAYGHRGSGGSVHAAWPGFKVGLSYVTNCLRESGGGDVRSASLLQALHDALVSCEASSTLAGSERYVAWPSVQRRRAAEDL